MLSLRELEILNLLPAGLTNKEIATRLFISPETVKTHIAHILKKTGARNRTEAACLVAALGRQNAGHFPGQGSRASLPVAAENGVSYEAISSQANEKKISSEVYK
ncbi:MAG: helix-turn-helix transcriptional regulator [Actinobacteria bacterium]|nr:helix-turn-helix transcriptional regulator [Actinomycetota bacterium]